MFREKIQDIYFRFVGLAHFSVFLLFSSTFFILNFAEAKSVNAGANSVDQMTQEGQFLTVRITKGNPIQIFVVGREEAKLELKDLKLTIRRIDPYPGKILSVSKSSNYFVVKDTEDFNKSNQVEIKTNSNGNEEVFNFNLKLSKP